MPSLKPNTIYCGDCLFVLSHDVPPSSVDLIYLDPPFFTGQIQKGTIKWAPDAMEVSFEDSKRFWTEKHYHGAPEWMKVIGGTRPDFAAYLYYMQQRLEKCKRVLKDTGSIYLHCDNRASHYLKMVMDEIFGDENFRNEIIWNYGHLATLSKKEFPQKHDTLLLYCKSADYKYFPDIIPSKKDITKNYPLVDENGNHYRWVTLQSKDGKLYKKKRVASRINAGGVPASNVWDIPVINPMSKERLGYPTQKPEGLLERIIKTTSEEGDLVLDPFCGCGTAIIVAERFKRKWIGIDINPDACDVMQKRFAKQFVFFPLIVTRTLNSVMKLEEREFEHWVNEFYDADKPSPDRGVDGITKDGIAIQTKAFAKPISYSVIDSFLTSARLHSKVPKPVKNLILISQSGFDDSAISRQFQIQNSEGVFIDLKEPKTMLKLEENPPQQSGLAPIAARR